MLTANATDNPMFVISLDIDPNGQAKTRIPDIEKSAQLHNTLLQGLFPDIDGGGERVGHSGEPERARPPRIDGDENVASPAKLIDSFPQ